SGAITATVPVGNNPGRIVVSDDGHYLYAALQAIAAVRRIDLRSMTPDIQFTLGDDAFAGPKYAGDLAVMPGHPHTVAVAMNYHSMTGSAGVAIFDDGIRRTNMQTSPPGSNVDWIAFGATADRLYGYDSESSGSDLTRMSIDIQGLAGETANGNLFRRFT